MVEWMEIGLRGQGRVNWLWSTDWQKVNYNKFGQFCGFCMYMDNLLGNEWKCEWKWNMNGLGIYMVWLWTDDLDNTIRMYAIIRLELDEIPSICACRSDEWILCTRQV